jgi:hypothetical protein
MPNQVTTEYRRGRATLTPGREFSVRGEVGRFRFVSHTITPDGREWIDAIGGKTDIEMWRSFRPDRIRRIHRIQKTRANLKGRRS